MKHFILTILTIFTTAAAFSQGSETFTNIPASSSTYAFRSWTGDNGLTWSADSARTDSSINGRAIVMRAGAIKCSNIPNGASSLSFKYRQVFTTAGGSVEVRINNVLVGTVAPTTTTQTATFDNLGVTGAFNLEIRNTGSVTNFRVGIDDVSWTGSTNFPCTTPSAQPSNLTFSNVTSTAMSGSFSASSPTSDEYLVVRSTSSTLTANPQDGTEYDAGDLLGGGIVLYRGTNTNFSSTGLSGGTTYYYYIFSINTYCNGGPLYKTDNPLKGSKATTTPTPCSQPANPATSLTLTPSNTSASGTFTASADADGYLVVRSTTANPGFIPANGTVYTQGQVVGNVTVVQFAEGTKFTAMGLSLNSTYYFFVYAMNQFGCSGGPSYNTSALSGSTTTLNNSTGEPTDYYTDASGKSCATLKSALKTIITNSHVPQSYADLYTQYKVTDIKPREVGTGSTSVIWDIYSDVPTGPDPYNYTPGTNECGNYSGEGDCYNREHSFPKSWFNDVAPAYSDYNHIFPTDGSVNGHRANYRYGEVATATYTSRNGSKLGSSSTAGISGTVFEPINEYKGDVARAFLYMVTRYQNLIPTWATYNTDGSLAMSADTFPSVNVSYLKLMLKWHHQDPVSDKEINRNKGTYDFQHNRNPYIDHPDYADLVWNSNCPGLSALPVNIIFFSGKLVGDKIKLEWTAENEINFEKYEVERSFNSASYNKIGEVKAANLRNYSFNDDANAISGRRVYYRLKRVDKDGNYKYSEVFTIHVPQNTRFSVYPNPAVNFIQLQINKAVVGKVVIQVTDVSGKVLQQQTREVNGDTIRLSTSALSAGTYLVRMKYNGEQYLQKVMVAK